MTEKKGRVINLNGGVYQVALESGELINIKARGKLRNVKVMGVHPKALSKKESVLTLKLSPKVGDNVIVKQDMISDILLRKNELIRPDIANVDQILLVFAAKEPTFSFYLLDLFIVNITKQGIEPLIVVTKVDLLSEEEFSSLKEKLSYYEKLGYSVLYVSSKKQEGLEEVALKLKNKVTVLSGQTGAGKSSLINALIPGFELHTQDISQALGRGKHTTRQTTLYPYQGGYIGDTPGFSKLNVLGIEKKELADLFLEFNAYDCKFKDCMHQENALGCGVHNAYLEHQILDTRYESYLKMLTQIKELEKK